MALEMTLALQLFRDWRARHCFERIVSVAQF
jgi:hypothetical protein